MAKEFYKLSRFKTIRIAKKLSELEERFDKEMNSVEFWTVKAATLIGRQQKISLMFEIDEYREQIPYRNPSHVARSIDAYRKKLKEGKVPFEIRTENTEAV